MDELCLSAYGRRQLVVSAENARQARGIEQEVVRHTADAPPGVVEQLSGGRSRNEVAGSAGMGADQPGNCVSIADLDLPIADPRFLEKRLKFDNISIDRNPRIIGEKSAGIAAEYGVVFEDCAILICSIGNDLPAFSVA
nr:hypothetical protein [Mesorhizobium sp. INR15]